MHLNCKYNNYIINNSKIEDKSDPLNISSSSDFNSSFDKFNDNSFNSKQVEVKEDKKPLINININTKIMKMMIIIYGICMKTYIIFYLL